MADVTNAFFNGTAEVKIGTLDVTSALLPGLSFSTTNPGGFGEATMRLPAQLAADPYIDLSTGRNLLHETDPSGSTWPTSWVREGEEVNYVPDSGCGLANWTFSAAGVTATRETSPPVSLPGGVTACTKADHTSGSWQYSNFFPAALSVSPGEVWRLSAYIHCSALSGDAIGLRYRTLLNGVEVRHAEGASVGAVNGSFVRVDFSVTIAAGENQLEFRSAMYNGTGTYWIAAAMATKTSDLLGYFDGDTADCHWMLPSPQLNPAFLKVNCFANVGLGVVLAGTYDDPSGGYIYRSTDYGLTWDAGRQLGAAQGVNVIIPVTSTVILAGSQGEELVSAWWRSVDAGLTWARMTSGLNLSPAEFGHCGALLSDGSIVLGTYGGSAASHIYRSTDGGVNWSTVYTSSVQGFFWLEDLGGGNVMAGSGIQTGTCQVFRSTDYGATWALFQTLGGTATHVLCIRKMSNGTVLLTTGTTGAVWKAASVGAQFVEVQQLGSETFCYVVTELADTTVLAGTMPNGSVYRSTDFGATWALVSANVAGAATIHDICDLSDNDVHDGIVLAATDNDSRVARSTDYGLNWSGTSTTPAESHKPVNYASGSAFHITDDAHVHSSVIRSPMLDVTAGLSYGFGLNLSVDTFNATLCEASVSWYTAAGWWLESTAIAAPSEVTASTWYEADAVAPATAARARMYVSWNTPTGACAATASGFAFAEARSVPAAWSAYHAQVVKGATVTIKHNTTQTLFEGVVTNDCTHATVEGGTAYYDVTAAGKWWVAGQKQDFACVFTDSDIGQWFISPSANKAIEVDLEGRIYLGLKKGQSTDANYRASVFYWLHNGMYGGASQGLSYFVAALDYDLGAANWYAKVDSSPDSPWDSWTNEQSWNNATNATGFTILPLTAGTQSIRVSLYSDADVGAAAATRYMLMSDVCVVSDVFGGGYWTACAMTTANPTQITTATAHGLQTGDRVAAMYETGSAGPKGWYTVTRVSDTQFTVPVLGDAGATVKVLRGPRISDAIRDIAGENASITTGLGATFDTENIGVPRYDLAIRPHTTRAEAIDSIATLHSAPIDYGFWESADFKTMVRATPDAANDYLVDATTPGIDYSVFAATEDSPAYVKVLYKLRDLDLSNVIPDGYTCAVYRPSEPTWAAAGVNLDVWDEFADVAMTTTQAQDLGDQILDWIADNVYTGTITIATPTVPKRAGGTKNTCYIRAGDYIADANHDATTGRMLITSTSFDADSGVMTVGVGENRADFVARLRTGSGYDMFWGPPVIPDLKRA